jgi:predicted patatin/cPLA2 family phospholipase
MKRNNTTLGFESLNWEKMQMAFAHAIGDYTEIYNWTVENWINYGQITDKFKNLENAKKALEIMNSPLYKALKEEK